VIIAHAAREKDFTNRRYQHRGIVDEVEWAKNRTKSKVRAKVEPAFFVIKRVFGFAKVCDRGLDKNAHRLFATCALADLSICCAHSGCHASMGVNAGKGGMAAVENTRACRCLLPIGSVFESDRQQLIQKHRLRRASLDEEPELLPWDFHPVTGSRRKRYNSLLMAPSYEAYGHPSDHRTRFSIVKVGPPP
jgi:hypothetical protein